MKDNSSQLSKNNMFRIMVGTFLFAYFGFIIFPEWSHPFSDQFLVWILLLPIVLIALIGTGIRGGIGLWRERFRNALPNPQNKYFIWVAILGILWFLISIAFAGPNHDAYFHQKFDTETWKTVGWEDGTLFELSLRERMLEDLTKNVLPGKTKIELLDLLGEPDEQRIIEGTETIFYYIGYNIMEPKCMYFTFDKQGVIEQHDITACG